MSYYKVPKLEIEVVVDLLGGGLVKGSIFLNESLITYMGDPSLDDLLNGEEPFFPFRHKDGQVSLINKHNVIYLKTWEQDALELVIPTKHLEVEIFFVNGESIAGTIHSDLPEDALWVSDFLNQEMHFLAIYRDDQKIIMNKDHILYIND